MPMGVWYVEVVQTMVNTSREYISKPVNPDHKASLPNVFHCDRYELDYYSYLGMRI